MAKDNSRLQRFARQADQSAFAGVVRRHLDLVFAMALRKTGDHGAAQEVAQNVFAALARKAWQFAPDDSLPAWLHKTALFQSNTWLRDVGVALGAGEEAATKRVQRALEKVTDYLTHGQRVVFRWFRTVRKTAEALGRIPNGSETLRIVRHLAEELLWCFCH